MNMVPSTGQTFSGTPAGATPERTRANASASAATIEARAAQAIGR